MHRQGLLKTRHCDDLFLDALTFFHDLDLCLLPVNNGLLHRRDLCFKSLDFGFARVSLHLEVREIGR